MRYGLLGYKIGYSLSPIIHRMIAMDDIEYNIIDIAPESFGRDIKDAVSGLSGFNVTIPYKENIMIYCHKIDAIAEKIGAVNTIDIHNGEWKGYNTDYLGFIRSVKEDIPQYFDYHPVIIGYGGVAKAVAYGLEKTGFPSISICGGISDQERHSFSESLKEKLNINVLNDVPDLPVLWINCTPVGGSKIPTIPEGFIQIKNRDFLYDLNYSPFPTYLEKEVSKRGIPSTNGMKMLVYQAVEAQKIWKKRDFYIEDPDSIIHSIAELNNVS